MEYQSIEQLRKCPAVTPEDQNLWIFASNMLIEQGRVDPIVDFDILKMKINHLADRIVALSVHSLMNKQTEEEMLMNTARHQADLDNELFNIAFGSKIHPIAIDVLLGEAVDRIAEETVAEIKQVRKIRGEDQESDGDYNDGWR